MKNTSSSQAVFISYASEDVDSAQAVSELLVANGVEVWFDRGELRGGDAWDSKITQQITDCALFIAIISENTQRRPEGYFRREWALAVDRTRDLAEDEPFLLPTVVDQTTAEYARVPRGFRSRQWVSLHGSEDRQAVFARHVRQLIDRKKTPSPFPLPSRTSSSAPSWPISGLSSPSTLANSQTWRDTDSRAPYPTTHDASINVPGHGRSSPNAPTFSGAAQTRAIDRRGFWLETRRGLTVLLTGVFAINWLETTLETTLKTQLGIGRSLESKIAETVYAMEGGLTFERHDVTNAFAVYGFSIAYFFLFPLLMVAVLATLARRRGVVAYRHGVFAMTIAYAISLPFFLFFPTPERWAFPDSEAILLSDLWTSSLIVFFRPISGLDNCFPSFHVSSIVVGVLLAYQYRLGLRHTVAFLGAAVALSTFALGIHWIPDIVAGLAVGVMSLVLAARMERVYLRRRGCRPASIVQAAGVVDERVPANSLTVTG